MRLGIMGAMEQEIATLLEEMQIKECVQRGVKTFYTGVLQGLDCVLVQCGIGKVNAAICAQQLVDLFEVDALLNTGIAGSLDAQLDIGDLVVSDCCVYHDVDATYFSYKPGQLPGEPQFFVASEFLTEAVLQTAQRLLPSCNLVKGTVCSGDQFIHTQQEKQRIYKVFGGLCCEMEGAAIAHCAYANKIPYVVIRAISDKADESAQNDYATFELQAAQHCAALVSAVAADLSQQNYDM